MTKIKLKYVLGDVDRYGNVRYYFRRNRKDKKIKLNGTPGSAEFMADYASAIAGKIVRPVAETPLHRKPGNFKYLAHQFYQWSEFKKLDPRSQRVRQNILEGFLDQFASLPYDKFEPRHLRQLMEAKASAGKPGAANNLLKALRHLFRYAVEFDLVKDDPTRNVRKKEYRKQPFHSWTIDEVEQFEATWPVGSVQRLALALLLYTGQRRQDVVAFGRQHVKDGALIFTQKKSRHLENPVTLEIPILPELQEIIDATPRTGLTFIENTRGKGYTEKSFGRAFREWCDKADLPHCTAHGLRKAAATRLSDLGATTHQIAAITGHRTLAEIAHYTRATDQKRTARAAIHMLKRGKQEGAT